MADDLLTRHRAVIPNWVNLYYNEPVEPVSGSGRHVTDSNGHTYLDFFAGILTNMLGYDVPEVNRAIQSQVDTGILHSSTLYLIRSQVELAERIAELSGIPDAKVFFTASGTEANEAALLFATSARRSNQVLALRGSYHGRSYAAMGITGNRGWSPSGLSPVDVSYLHGGDRLRGPFVNMSDEGFNQAGADDLREVLATTTSGDVACLIAEPIQGVNGFVTPPDGYLGALQRVLNEEGILLISDEVQTGWGRTGEHFWGYQAHGVTPDLITFAKGLGNGMTIGGVVGRAEIMESIGANSISTFGGNPVSTRAALATLDFLEEHRLQANAYKTGLRLLEGLRQLDYPIIGEVRGKGLMTGLELVEPGTTIPSAAAAATVLDETKRLGLLIGKGGLYGNALRIAPPLTVTEDEVDEALEILGVALADANERASRGRKA